MIPRGLFVLGLVVASWADPIPESGLEDCFKKDSISCVQIQLFRNARSFFDQESVELFGGLSLVKNPGTKDKSARALEDSSENQVLTAKDVDQREELLEAFAIKKLGSFFQERSLSWNLSPVVDTVAATARSLVNSVPADVKENISEYVEGRGKKKKLLKALLPLLIGLKVKLAAFGALAYVVIALIAKKALLASLISLAISGFIAIKKLLSQHHHPQHHEVVAHPVEYSSHGGGWSGGGGGGGGWDSYSGHGDSHGSYSNNVAHSIAYSAQKPVRRR